MATYVVISSVQIDPIIIALETTLAVVSYIYGSLKKYVSFVFVIQLGATVVVIPNFCKKGLIQSLTPSIHHSVH
jgi:hypothetical protein